MHQKFKYYILIYHNLIEFFSLIFYYYTYFFHNLSVHFDWYNILNNANMPSLAQEKYDSQSTIK